MALRYEDYITRAYQYVSRSRDNFPSSLSRDITLEDNEFNKLSIKVDISKPIVEIPCIVKFPICNVLLDKILFDITYTEDQVIIPLFRNPSYYCNSVPRVVKSANPLLKSLFVDTPGNNIMNWCKCGDTLYYGGPGLLLYDDMTPMVMFTLLVEKGTDNKYNILYPIVRVSPEVYTRDDLMSKHIRSKMLCSMMEMRESWLSKMYMYNSNLFNDSSYFATFKVIIDDFYNEWFETPMIPSINDNSESINNFLVDNFTLDDLR